MLPFLLRWRSVLQRALKDAQGDRRLAFVLFSKWAKVRYRPRMAIRAISWAHPIYTSPTPPSLLKEWDARLGPATTPTAGDSSPATREVEV